MEKIYLLFLLFGLFHCLIDFSLREEKMKKERIFSTIKLIMFFLQSKLNEPFLEFRFSKYNIIFANFSVINPSEKDIKIINTNSLDTFSINNITISFIYDNYIYFSDESIKMEDLNKIIAIKFSEIKFIISDDKFLNISSFDVSSLEMSNKSKISKLNYFKEFTESLWGKTEKKVKLKEGNSTNIKEEIKKKFENILEKRIIAVMKKINLLTYDFEKILNLSSSNITCSNPEEYEVDYIIIKSYNFDNDKLNIDFNKEKIVITDLKIKGIFQREESFLEFNASLAPGKQIVLNYSNITFPNEPFIIYNMKKEFGIVLNTDYVNYIYESYIEYYESLKN